MTLQTRCLKIKRKKIYQYYLYIYIILHWHKSYNRNLSLEKVENNKLNGGVLKK